MQSETLPDIARLAEELHRHPELRYVLVGGMAVILHGGTRITMDADLAIAYNADNVRRIVKALAPFRPRPMRLAEGAAWEWDEKCVRAPWSIYMTDVGRIDLIVRLGGVESFEALYARSEVLDLGGVPLRVASIDDLVAMKRVADRDRDRDDVNQLLAIKRLLGFPDQGERKES